LTESSSEFITDVAAARNGDRDALARLVAQYEPKVRIVARVVLGRALQPHLDSVDLVQSVHRSLMIALRTRDYDFSDPDQLVALAVTMVRRKAARHWRRIKRQTQLDPNDQENLPQLLLSLSDAREGPEAEARFKDQVEWLCSGLDELEKRMVHLRLQGFTSPEVAERLGMHAVAIRVRWTRLRKRLQQHGVSADWM
jgi:RNA polymerase sigma-70 factor (ECF subfamily)